MILFFTIRENKLTEELKDEMALGEELAAIENPVADDAPMTKANRRMLIAVIAVCVTFIIVVAINTVRETRWQDTVKDLQTQMTQVITEIRNGTQ